VTWLVVAPLLVSFAAVIWWLAGDMARVALLLPGLLAMPLFRLIPRLNGDAVPLSRPTDESKSAKRGLRFLGVILAAMVIAGLAVWARSSGWLLQFLAVEAAVVGVACLALRPAARGIAWPSME
jgi:hypothetical protein